MTTVNRDKGSISVDGVRYTAKAVTRHTAPSKKNPDENPGCKFYGAANSSAIASCDCMKAIEIYDGNVQKQNRISANTRSWQQAEKFAEAWLDQFDPTKIEQIRQEAAAVTVPAAVSRFLSDKLAQKIDADTVRGLKSILGDAGPDGGITKDGKLFPWLVKQKPPVKYVSDISSTHLMAWRESWSVKDSTASNDWGKVRGFFNFCMKHGWIDKNPAAFIKRGKVEKGTRTAPFTDTQWAAILKAADDGSDLQAFLLLCRWSGTAIVDATLFDIDNIDAKGVLNYNRKKTGRLATVALPKDVVKALRTISKTSKQPFRRTDLSLAGNKNYWRKLLRELFAKAGTARIKTQLGERDAHPHMLRDTCAVWYLRKGLSIHSVAKILGDTVGMVEKHYAPFVSELRQAVIDETKAILQASGG